MEQIIFDSSYLLSTPTFLEDVPQTFNPSRQVYLFNNFNCSHPSFHVEYPLLTHKEWQSFILWEMLYLFWLGNLSNFFSCNDYSLKKKLISVMLSFRSTITSSIKILAGILSTILYFFLILKFAAIQFCQHSFFQRISKKGSEYMLVWNSKKLMNLWLIMLLGDLRFYYDIFRFTAPSPRHPKETANLKSCL